MIDIRAAKERFHTSIGWLDSWHSFSFAEHYDPQNTHHGLLRVLNDDVVAPGAGFGMHPHRDMEIVTWVLDGALEHRDTEGNVGVITRHVAQRMSAGTGLRHSEMNASETEPVHLLQMWVPPDTGGIPPGYEQRDVDHDFRDDELFLLASGRDDAAAIHIHQRFASLWVARLSAARHVTLPDAPFVHVLVAEGSAQLGDATLETGDAARLTDAGALDLAAGPDGAHIVVWEMYSTLAQLGALALVLHESAVDHVARAGDVRGVIGREEHREPSDLGRRRGALHRDRLCLLVAHSGVVDRVLIERRQHHAGRDVVDGDACFGQLQAERRARSGEARTTSPSSVNDISSGRRGGLRSHRGPGGRTKEQLYNEAKTKNVPGRSKMNKAQLARAVGR